jgi:predicted acyltransferase
MRQASLDVFRGFTMVWMISEGILSPLEGHPVWGWLATQFTHREWHGMHAWDMIQPFFMFIVGVAMPYSFARRAEEGESWTRSLGHVLKRCALLILWGLVARSVQAGKPNLDLINVLAQVSFTYLVAFLLMRFPWRTQLVVASAILALHSSLYLSAGFADPWSRNSNIGAYWDRVVLGKNWGGGYATINCLSSAFNTIAGVIAGVWLRAGSPVRPLSVGGASLVVAGLLLNFWIPINKKIWTASFALVSTGICLLTLLLFYFVCDVWQKRRWGRVFVIVGTNSIFIYLFHEILGRWMRQTAPVFFGWAVDWWGAPGKMLMAAALIGLQIYVCWWLYQRKIFFKL